MKKFQYRGEDGQHESRGCRITHEHGEDGSDQHQTQHHKTGIVSKWTQQYPGQIAVKSIFGSSNGEEESSQEKHDDG